jgi:hypothetical protein
MDTVKLSEGEWKKPFQQIPADLKQKIENVKAEQKALRWLDIFR